MVANAVSIQQLTGRQVRAVTQARVAVSRMPRYSDILTGIEIEGENVNITSAITRALIIGGWSVQGDGSLRNGQEFVLSEPLAGQSLASAMDVFNEAFTSGLTYEENPRAGIHIHMNVSDKTLGFVRALAAAFWCLEPAIYRMVGEDRRWCSYSNSLNTVEAVRLRSLLSPGACRYESWADLWDHNGSSDRYYGCNLQAVRKYGSVELRYFPSTNDITTLWKWIDMCHAIFKFAEHFANEEDPATAVLKNVSGYGSGALYRIFDGEVPEGLEYDGWQEDMTTEIEDLLDILLAADGVDVSEEAGWSELRIEEFSPAPPRSVQQAAQAANTALIRQLDATMPAFTAAHIPRSYRQRVDEQVFLSRRTGFTFNPTDNDGGEL